MTHLFSPLVLRSVTARNRAWVAPMCQYSAFDGVPNDWHLVHLGSFARGGAGLVLTEATAVSPEGRISPVDTGIWNDGQAQAWSRIVDFVHGQGAPVGMQLAHAGRKASTRPPFEGRGWVPVEEGGWEPLGPSAVPFPKLGMPRQMTTADIDKVVDDFAEGARRALRVGFDLFEIHAAHGYLLHEFLSPLSNRRDDAYGGPLENRLRLPLEVFDAVRAAWPGDRPLGVRVSATDWVEGGWEIEQCLEFVGALVRRGCDWIDCSSGGISPQQKIPLAAGYQVPFAKRIRAETGMKTIAVGLITEPQEAEAIVAGGDADMVALARAMLYDPRWAWHAAAALGATAHAPEQYWRCAPSEAGRVFGNTQIGMR